MFGWFKPKSALSDDQRDWIDWRFEWLRQQFGAGPLWQPTVVPSHEFFPDAYRGTRDDVEILFRRVCEYMRIQRTRIRLNFYHRQRDGHAARIGQMAGGLCNTDDFGNVSIWLEESRLQDAMSVVSTLAHELAHVHLLADGRLQTDEPDHEHLTDLAVIYFGLGIFLANNIRRDSSWYSGGWSMTSVETSGYLRMPEAAYALALYAHLREESKPDWLKHVRPDVRVDLVEEARHLASGHRMIWKSNGDVRPIGYNSLIFQPVSESGEVDTDHPVNAEIDSEDGLESRPTDDSPDFAEADDEDADTSETNLLEIADQHFTEGTMLALEGRHAEAIEEFTKTHEINPDDSEALRERAISHLALGNIESAIEDSTQRLNFVPRDGLALLCRAEASLEAGRCTDALNDLKGFSGGDDLIATVRLLRGLAYFGEGDHKRAIQEFTRSIHSDPNRADPYLARSRAYDVSAQPQLALRDLQEAIDRNPDYADKTYRDSVLASRMPFQRFRQT